MTERNDHTEWPNLRLVEEYNILKALDAIPSSEERYKRLERRVGLVAFELTERFNEGQLGLMTDDDGLLYITHGGEDGTEDLQC